jgi:hypothetical protein
MMSIERHAHRAWVARYHQVQPVWYQVCPRSTKNKEKEKNAVPNSYHASSVKDEDGPF